MKKENVIMTKALAATFALFFLMIGLSLYAMTHMVFASETVPAPAENTISAAVVSADIADAQEHMGDGVNNFVGLCSGDVINAFGTPNDWTFLFNEQNPDICEGTWTYDDVTFQVAYNTQNPEGVVISQTVN